MRLEKQDSGIYWGIWYYEGRRIVRSSKTKNYELAKRWWRAVDRDLYEHYVLKQPAYIWEDAADGYMLNREGKASYNHDVKRLEWMKDYLGGVKLTAVNADLLTSARDKLLERVAPATANRYMTLISAVLHYAERREWIIRAPYIPKVEVEERAPVYLTPEEVDSLVLELAKSPRSKHLVAFVTFAIATGLRLRNITRLEWPQIDMQRKVMWVKAETAKGSKSIPVPLMADAIEVIKSQVGKHNRRVFTYRGKPFDAVKTGEEGTLAKAAKRAGIEKHVHPHLFRHTFASWLVMSGTPLYDVMKLGGWQKIDSVMIYAHLSAEHLQTAAANRKLIDNTYKQALKVMK